VKLAVSVVWLLALALTLDPRPALALVLVTLVAALAFGGVRPSALARGVVAVGLAAFGVGCFNALLAAANADPDQVELLRLGPLRVTEAAVAGGVSLGLRALAIGSLGVAFALTTDATRLLDSLVSRLRVPERFAYGAYVAYQCVPRFADDLAQLREARRIRGLGADRRPRLVLALLVVAIRRGDRLALAMDGRGFGSGPRSRFRDVRWSSADAAVGLGAMAVLALAFGVVSR